MLKPAASPSQDVPESTPWTLADLIDLEWRLAQEPELPLEERTDRDRRIAREELRPALGDTLTPEAPAEVRSRGLRLWLKARQEEARGESVGEMAMGARRVVGLILGLLAVLAGSGLVMGLLHREWRYFNVVHFLLATLGPQFLLLVLLLLGAFWGKLTGAKKAPSVWRSLVASLWERLASLTAARRVSDKLARRQAARFGGLLRPWLVWPVARLTQTAAIWYNLGLMGAFVGVLLGMDVRFFWESTPGGSAERGLHAVVEGLARPWSWLAPGLVPTVEEIHRTRMSVTGGEGGWSEPEGVRSAEIWAPFLLASLACWGLLPRLLLLGFCAWRERAVVRGQSFGDRAHRELWRRLSESSRLLAKVEGPGDDAVVCCWGGVSPKPEEMRPVLLQQLRLNPVRWFAAGGLDVAADENAVREIASVAGESAERPLPLVLIAEAWGLAPRDLGPFLKSLRQALGESPVIRCLLLGEPKNGRVLTPPGAEDLAVWESFAASLGDSGLVIRPLRDSLA